VVTLCAVSLLAAGMSTAATASASPTHTRPAHPVGQPDGKPVLVDCSFEPQTRPDTFILACGDGNSRLSSLRWSQWDGEAAVARGVNSVNDCKPYCAAGTFRSYPVIVRLDRPEPWKKRPRTQHFTRLSLVFPAARPDGYQRTVTYPLWG
jgi:hypothetical protein